MMAKYTITIKTLIDNNFDFKMTDYPIFDENYRETIIFYITIMKMKLVLKLHHYLDFI